METDRRSEQAAEPTRTGGQSGYTGQSGQIDQKSGQSGQIGGQTGNTGGQSGHTGQPGQERTYRQLYSPIPVPFHQKLRQFRVRILPIIVFLVVSGVVALLWEQRIHAPGLVGQVVADRAVIASPASGWLSGFHHTEFDEVHEGELLGYLVREDSTVVRARLNVILSEIEMIRQGLDPIVGEQRNRMNLEELRVDHINHQIALAGDQLRLQQSAVEYERLADLKERDLVSDQEYERALNEVDLLRIQVEEKQRLIDHLEERIGEIEKMGSSHAQLDRDPVMASIEVQERRIEALLAEASPRPVYATMDGVISRVHSGEGQFLEEGQPIVEIESRDPTHIVGYVRQPFTRVPEAGMQVEVRSRKPGRDYFISHIEQLGGHIDLIREDLQRPGALYESGLPVQIALAEVADSLSLTPGEIVDIVLRPGRE